MPHRTRREFYKKQYQIKIKNTNSEMNTKITNEMRNQTRLPRFLNFIFPLIILYQLMRGWSIITFIYISFWNRPNSTYFWLWLLLLFALTPSFWFLSVLFIFHILCFNFFSRCFLAEAPEWIERTQYQYFLVFIFLLESSFCFLAETRFAFMKWSAEAHYILLGSAF